MIKGLAQNGLEKEAIEFSGDEDGRLGDGSVYLWECTTCLWGLGAIKEGKSGRAEEAVKMFLEMERSGVEPDHYTLGQAISACANISSLEEGSQFHGKAVTSGLVHYVIVSNSLVTLYGKCGNIDDSTKLFNEMSFRDEVSWTAMVSAYAQFGRAIEAIDLFDRMVQHGLKPDGVTLTGVISACSRAGLVEKGQRYFELMTNEYGIVPSNGHYSCMIDLFSRSGRLEEAMSFINGMPFPPDAIGWITLLSACRNKGNLEIVEAGDEREESEKRTWTELDQVEREIAQFLSG
ncbi:hypothetical protein Bca52824_083828 [Brassica carinata]|uniref:Pentatricopeptide repeat-containing protein n=1 Tax=Brassica carinata TaxID=52824 RepID=A0A8X7PN71_BRACI|nr:hypothetical protein Bca52824_083828 [Brassica carinata]